MMIWRLTCCFTVKYHAYLRKMTRYNPTRGGMLNPDDNSPDHR